ncbi:hypothetical protein EMCRGX_G017281, partial [Ephydatia muelleri]
MAAPLSGWDVHQPQCSVSCRALIYQSEQFDISLLSGVPLAMSACVHRCCVSACVHGCCVSACVHRCNVRSISPPLSFPLSLARPLSFSPSSLSPPPPTLFLPPPLPPLSL